MTEATFILVVFGIAATLVLAGAIAAEYEAYKVRRTVRRRIGGKQ